MNAFSDLVRIALIQKGIAIKELATMLEMSQPSLSRKLKTNNFNETDMRRIAELLGMKLVLNLEDEPKQ